MTKPFTFPVPAKILYSALYRRVDNRTGHDLWKSGRHLGAHVFGIASCFPIGTNLHDGVDNVEIEILRRQRA
jgi:hypothetical protein